ncbi:hypothetical protein NZL82_15790 [Sphingomonas sanguinis]|uniref:hypothetical protein n=1 Tax=Sphingomonas sp. LC-1 TaxID=3110957 RepID=UPI0021BBB4F5|nr:hypothetical protein [Sphingomonas sp. LC-1]MCT8003337.1 hypothetical protein [Sphingomonas sp. LC-1]
MFRLSSHDEIKMTGVLADYVPPTVLLHQKGLSAARTMTASRLLLTLLAGTAAMIAATGVAAGGTSTVIATSKTLRTLWIDRAGVERHIEERTNF